MLGDLTAVSQGYCPYCQSRTFRYDALGRLASSTQPESGTVAYAYDNAENVFSTTDNRGITTTLTYDALNRLTQRTFSDGVTPAETFRYDGSGVANGMGRLSSVSNAHATENYTSYDSLGRVKASNQVTAGQTYAFSYSYNLARQLISETYPSGRTVATGYDAVNRPVTVSRAVGGVVTSYLSSAAYWPQGGRSCIFMATAWCPAMGITTGCSPVPYMPRWGTIRIPICSYPAIAGAAVTTTARCRV